MSMSTSVLPEAEIPKAQAWYAKTFGGKAGTRNNAPVVDVPGGQLRFAKADTKQAPTRGRVLDHIGFDVKDHQAFVKKIEAEGIKLDEPVRKSPERQHHHLHHRSLGHPHRDHRAGALGSVGAVALALKRGWDVRQRAPPRGGQRAHLGSIPRRVSAQTRWAVHSMSGPFAQRLRDQGGMP